MFSRNKNKENKGEAKKESEPSAQPAAPWHRRGDHAPVEEQKTVQKRKELKEFEPDSKSYFNVGTKSAIGTRSVGKR